MPPSAAEIIERTISVYASCASYRDTGKVVTDYTNSDGAPLVRGGPLGTRFTTLFVRPGWFRYELTYSMMSASPFMRYVVWSDTQAIRSWHTLNPKIEESRSIREALAGPTGIDGGSAYRVSALLLPGIHPSTLPHPDSAKVREETTPSGKKAFVVSGADPTGNALEVRMDALTGLLLEARSWLVFDQAAREKIMDRIVRYSPSSERNLRQMRNFFGAGPQDPRSVATTTYESYVDVDIPAAAFAFTPPE